MKDESLVPGRSYWLKLGTRTVPATITALKHRIDVDTGAHAAARTLAANEIGFCNVATGVPIAFDSYKTSHDTGGFILIDRLTQETAAAGMISFALRRASNIHWQDSAVSPGKRAEIKGQQGAILWFTGLSGAGKSTIADRLEQKLVAVGCHTMLLDGDNVRHGLNRDLGFTDADRVENIRRVGEVARLMGEAGLVAICAFISPFRADRQMARQKLVASGSRVPYSARRHGGGRPQPEHGRAARAAPGRLAQARQHRRGAAGRAAKAGRSRLIQV